MDICVPFCGSAKTSLHNQVMLEGVKSTLMAAKGTSSGGSTGGRVETEGSEDRSWSEAEKNAGIEGLWQNLCRMGIQSDVLPPEIAPDSLWNEGSRRLHDQLLGGLGALKRSRESVGDASHLASRRRFETRAVQRRLRSCNGCHQGQDFGAS